MKKTIRLVMATGYLIFLYLPQAFSQNVGIGTLSPKARLHVIDSSVLFSAGDFPPTPGNAPANGSGRRMMWYVDKAAFRVGYVSGPNWDTDSIGYTSFASNYNTRATGTASTAMGNITIASGDGSTAMGLFTKAGGIGSTAMGDFTFANGYASTTMGEVTTANGAYSTAIGYNTKANGEASTAMGYTTTANGYASTVVGISNIPIVLPEAVVTNSTPLFIVGNGIFGSPSNAMAVFKSGNVGIGTNAPTARLHVLDSNVLFSAAGDIAPFAPNAPASGSGRRLLWYASKAAFRVGYVSGNNWDTDNIGYYSFATGYDTKATEHYSIATGYATTSNGLASTAMGYGTTANGFGSTSYGNATTANGNFSASFGYHTTANGYASTVVGMYNTPIVSQEFINTNTTPLFIIGNGEFNSLSNAMTVLKNGNTGIGNNAPAERLVVNGNILVQNNKGIIRSNDGT